MTKLNKEDFIKAVENYISDLDLKMLVIENKSEIVALIDKQIIALDRNSRKRTVLDFDKDSLINLIKESIINNEETILNINGKRITDDFKDWVDYQIKQYEKISEILNVKNAYKDLLIETIEETKKDNELVFASQEDFLKEVQEVFNVKLEDRKTEELEKLFKRFNYN